MSASEFLRIRFANARGCPVGTSSGRCKFDDATVAKARAMRAAGAHYKDIAATIGCAIGTVHAWCNGRRRNPHARIVVCRAKRTKTPPQGMVPDAPHRATGAASAAVAAWDSTGDSENPEKGPV